MATKGGLKIAIKFTPQAQADELKLSENVDYHDGVSVTSGDADQNILYNDGGGDAAHVMAIIGGNVVDDVKAHLDTYVNLANFSTPVGYTSVALSDGLGDTGTLSLDGSGNVTFTSDADFNFLSEGESANFGTITYVIRMANGAFSVSTAHITIVGENDGVVIGTADDTGSVNELASTTGSSTHDEDGGSIAYTDADLHDTHTVDVSYNNDAALSYTGDIPADTLTGLGTALTALVTDDGYGDGAGSVAWTFSEPDKDFDFLAAGDTLTVSYDVTIKDGHGGDQAETVTVTVHGANDDATFSGDDIGSVTEAGTAGPGNPDASGTLTPSDVDHDQSTIQAQDNVETNYGHFTIDEDGNWTYQLDNDNPDVDALDEGDTLEDDITVQSADGTEHIIKITINGADDTPPAPTDTDGPDGVNFVPNPEAGNNLNLGHFVAFGDSDPDGVTYSLVSGPLGVSVDATTGDLGFTAVTAGIPDTTITVRATDDAGHFGDSTFNLWVGSNTSGDTHSLLLASGSSGSIGAGQGGGDAITGTSGVDYIYGGSLADTITGGGGADWLNGGAGASDTFKYIQASDSTHTAFDKVAQFDAGATGNHDTLDFAAISGLSNTQGSISAGGTVNAHSIAWYADGADTVVVANTSGAGETSGTAAVDMEIHLIGVNAADLSASGNILHA